MDAVVLVALAGVAPVEHEDAAVGAVAEVDAAEPGVAGEEDVGLVAADVAAPVALEPLDVDPPAVEVQGEELAAVGVGPLVGQVDHQAAVGVAAAAAVVLAGLAVRESVQLLGELSQCQWSACWSISA